MQKFHLSNFLLRVLSSLHVKKLTTEMLNCIKIGKEYIKYSACQGLKRVKIRFTHMINVSFSHYWSNLYKFRILVHFYRLSQSFSAHLYCLSMMLQNLTMVCQLVDWMGMLLEVWQEALVEEDSVLVEDEAVLVEQEVLVEHAHLKVKQIN